MSSNSFKVKNSLVLTPKDLAALVSPEAGDIACDINDSNKIKRYDSASASWVEVGSGGVGGVDIMFVQDFESASLSSFTQTGLSLSTSSPLHGKISALLTHQAAINQSFKQVIAVDRKFRGESITLRLNSKSNASAGNVTINIYDETNAANIVASEQLQLSNDTSGAISQVGFTIPATCASISYTITALPEAGSPVTRIDDVIAELAVTSLLETVVELTGNAQTLTIPLTQSGLVQEADSMVQVDTYLGYGSTATKIPRFSTLRDNVGSSILYQDSSVDGSSFTVQESGVYSFTFSMAGPTGSTNLIGLSKNATGADLSTDFSILNVTKRLSIAYVGNITGTSSGVLAQWTGYLDAGDVIRPHTTGLVPVVTDRSHFTATKQGSLKQVTVNTNSKITIPTSELRFEGASSRGTGGESSTVIFITLAKIRGDAFSVDSSNGTIITMRKAGKLDISSSLLTSQNVSIVLSKNGTQLSTQQGNATGGAQITSAATSTFVNVGDTIKVLMNGNNPTSSATNSLNLSFQEQDIAVSVTNTLPQFSESDSCVRLSGAGASPFGSSATTTRRFASVVQNLGTDIEYIDSASLGGQFIAKASGIYNVSYTEESNSNAPDMSAVIRLNGSTIAYDNQVYNTASAAYKAASASWQGYLNVGDIITPTVGVAANNNGASAIFTMSKVGKPNVTGVNVTPFINVPQPESQASYYNASGVTGSTFPFLSITPSYSVGGGIYSVSTGTVTALKKCTLSVAASVSLATTDVFIVISRNGVDVAYDRAKSATSTTLFASASATIPLNAGDVITFSSPAALALSIALSATANSDQILTAPETFSTDTAALTYASSAAYTLSTLANAPVGTFITFTYAANTNTRTQTTVAPTQTTANMNTNGILLYTRAYNAASTAAQPAAIAIQIGKGLKGVSNNLYFGSGKTTQLSTDLVIISTTVTRGIQLYGYNELTGILLVDVGYQPLSTTTNAGFQTVDGGGGQSSGYLVVNASKNPALTGLGLGTVAARGVNTAGTSISNVANVTLTYDSVKTFDTNGALNTATGIFTAPETGYYRVICKVQFVNSVYAINNRILIQLFKNGSVYSSLNFISVHTVSSVQMSLSGSDTVFLGKGDTVNIDIGNNRTAGATALDAGAGNTYFSIVKTSIGTGN